MGAWGPAIFSDDTASDVRDEYRDHVGDGMSGVEATDRLLSTWREALEDEDEASVFWLALAATQQRCGRLEDRVRDEALAIIESGSDLSRWSDQPEWAMRRRVVLQDLAAYLHGPQSAPKRIRKRRRFECEWPIGEHLAYRLPSGRYLVLRGAQYHDDRGGRAPIFQLMRWTGSRRPPMWRMRWCRLHPLPDLKLMPESRSLPRTGFVVLPSKGSHFARDKFVSIGNATFKVQDIGPPMPFVMDNQLDEFLESEFGRS